MKPQRSVELKGRPTRKFCGLFWFIGFILLATLCVAGDVVSRLKFVRAANQVITSDVPRGSLPVAPNARERWTVLPASSMDARWWVIHTEEGMRTGAWRIRGTKLDNTPYGRELHWSSGLIWLLNATARVNSAFSGLPAIDEVQNAPLWIGCILLTLGATMVAILVVRRYGWAFAGFHVLLLATSFPLVEGFRVGEADHHGIAILFALGSVFSLVAGGAGVIASPGEKSHRAFLPVEQARKWFVTAGLLGAAGIWVSAASMIQVLAACALGAMLAAFVMPKDRHVCLAPELWRVWAKWGCLGSLAFYLVEYFPDHLGWRLEVNHPLYALAWLAGGDLLCRISRKLAGGRILADERADRFSLVAALLGVLVAPVVIYLRSDAVFWVADPFLLTLHNEHIREFAPLRHSVLRGVGFTLLLDFFVWPVFAVVGLVVLLWARVANAWRPLLAFAFVAAAVMQVQALFQVRWVGFAVALWSVCVLLLIVIYRDGDFSVPIPRGLVVGFGCLAVSGILAFPQLVFRTLFASHDVANQLPQNIVPSILLRDIAHRLIQSSPQRLPVVLSDPTSSTELTYYAGIQTIGTLYWDNAPGLKRAARIFSAPTEAQVRELLAEASVTHLVVPTWDALSTGSSHLRLLQKADGALESQTECYLDRVLQGRECPVWLRPFHYPIPASFGLQKEAVRIFEVRHDQTRFESYFFQGIYHAETGAFPTAAGMFRKSLELKPGNVAATQWLAQVAPTKSPLLNSIPNPSR